MKTRILLIALASSGLASAFTIVQTKSHSGVPDYDAPLVFDKFDDLGGTYTLTSITITTDVTKTGGSLYVDNDSGDPASGNLTQNITITLDSVDVALLASTGGLIGVNVIATSTYMATTAADNGDGAGFQAEASAPLNDYDGATFVTDTGTQTKNVKSTVWSDYIGATGTTYTIHALGSQGFTAAAFGGAFMQIAPATGAVDVTVTYNYIPEPAAALLGGLGLLTILRRRRR